LLSKIESKRLSVESVRYHEKYFDEIIVDILTDKATEYLPSGWQGLTTASQAKQWMVERLDEGGIYSLSFKGKESDACIGFLFIYGLNESSSSSEVRIGYIISEKYWGQGLASELIALVIKTLKSDITVSVLLGGVASENIASIKVLTKNGFVYRESENGTDFYAYEF